MTRKIQAPAHQILVVDDHPLLREGITQLINQQDDLNVCAEADSVPSADSAIGKHQPDLVLLDLRLGTGDTIEFIKCLRAREEDVRILVLSQYDESLYAERAMRAGADGYIVKQEAPNEVLTAIRLVLDGKGYVSRKIATLLFRRGMKPSAAEKEDDAVGSLSDREFHVFQLLGAGMTTRQNSEELSLSIKTIESYREHIKNKLSLQNSPQLVSEATRWVQRNAPGSPIQPRKKGRSE